VTRIVSIENGQVETYTGNYSDFEAQRADRLSQQQVAFERQQREVKHILDFVARFKAKATKARQAQSRLKMLERMERIAPAHVDSPFEFSFLEPARLPRPLLVLDRAKLGYGDRVIIDGASMSISPGDRIGLLGRNGAGKSTLTKALAGTQELLSGRRTTAQDLLVGYFAQHQIELLDAQSSAIEHLKRLGGDSIAKAPEEEQRNFLGGFGFAGDRVFEPVGPFSGGEKARLVLALVVSRRPNLLLLDEPTNHLDLEMRHALGMALQDYTGAIVLVSHDRYLLKLVADELWLVNEGQAAPFDGDLDDYANWLRTAANSSRNSAKIEEAPRSAASEKERKRAEAARRAELAPIKAVITQSEREMTKISPRLSELELLLADPALYEPTARARLTTLLTEQASLKSKLEAAELAWLSASEAYEAAERQQI
jgi:ATP-binding cassette subfamily F protein 3